MIWGLISAVLSYALVPLLLPVFTDKLRKNYLGEEIPTSLGIAFVLSASLIMVARIQSQQYATLFALLVLFFALLGLIDDVYGEQSRKGFRGHLSSLHLSTGALKALGGIAIALFIAWPVTASWIQLPLNGIIIALTANLINLLDVRPGRAAKAFLVFAFIVYLLKPQTLGPLLVLFWAVAGFLPWDLRRVAMMGDVGSNSIGAALGLACVIVVPVYGRIVLMVALIALNALSEKVSFSMVIESNRFLRYFDQLGR